MFFYPETFDSHDCPLLKTLNVFVSAADATLAMSFEILPAGTLPRLVGTLFSKSSRHTRIYRENVSSHNNFT
jgi:hypothetical protein